MKVFLSNFNIELVVEVAVCSEQKVMEVVCGVSV